jgi:hypothetical protein
MKNKEIILYDNCDIYSHDKREEMRQILFDELGEEQDWITPIDVPDSMIEESIREDDDIRWQDFTDNLEKVLEKGCLLTGSTGRWDGRHDGGKFVSSLSEFYRCIEHLNEVTITDKNGHLLIEGYHHDGFDHYELKKLTKKGYEYADNNYFANSRKLHNTIFNNNFYSCLPRLASI